MASTQGRVAPGGHPWQSPRVATAPASLRAALVLAGAAVVAACEVLPLPGPPGMLTQAQAIEAARAESRGAGEVANVRFSDEPDGPRWTVVFRMEERRPCGPAPGRVTCHITSRTVVLDARTGAFLEASESGDTTIEPGRLP